MITEKQFLVTYEIIPPPSRKSYKTYTKTKGQAIKAFYKGREAQPYNYRLISCVDLECDQIRMDI